MDLKLPWLRGLRNTNNIFLHEKITWQSIPHVHAYGFKKCYTNKTIQIL